MALKYFNSDFSTLSKDKYIRVDEKYHVFLKSSGWNLFNTNGRELVRLKDILIDDYRKFDYEEGEDYKGIPTGQSYIDEDGDIINFDSVTSENHPNRLKYKASDNNILISSLRLAKSPALYFKDVDLKNYIFSNGYFIFKIKKGWNIKFILYLLRSKRLKTILDNHIYRGIGISAYKDEDLKKVQFPLISEEIQNKIVEEIEPLEKKLQIIKRNLKSTREIFDLVFSREFNFNVADIGEIDKNHNIFLNLSSVSYKNTNIRSSYRWNQLQRVQKVMYKNNPYLQYLGKYIKNTKNGWSPECNEDETGQAVLGIDAIQKTGDMIFDNLKYTQITRENISDFFIREGDFFVSRGNTTDLVALASIVGGEGTNLDIIYPDLMIKVDFDESEINKKYLVYLFNSIIGRIYFKYSAKGKNQTMVKISAKELYDFYLPVPNIEIQRRIVDEIKEEIDSNNKYRMDAAKERQKIDSILENYFL